MPVKSLMRCSILLLKHKALPDLGHALRHLPLQLDPLRLLLTHAPCKLVNSFHDACKVAHALLPLVINDLANFTHLCVAFTHVGTALLLLVTKLAPTHQNPLRKFINYT